MHKWIIDPDIRIHLSVGATSSNSNENVQERRLGLYLYSNCTPQALVPTSELEPHPLDDPNYSGVFQVVVEDLNGIRRSYGTGFFVRLKLEDDAELFGFLTCGHVINYTQIPSGLPHPSQIFIQRENNMNRIWFRNEWEPVGIPLFYEDDVYFLVFSLQQHNQLEAMGINFLYITEENTSPFVRIPQYPIRNIMSPRTEFRIAKGLLRYHMTGQKFLHESSTLGGSSGARIMIHLPSSNEYRVIGMHAGTLGIEENYGFTISRIMKILNAIRHGTQPPQFALDESMKLFITIFFSNGVWSKYG